MQNFHRITFVNWNSSFATSRKWPDLVWQWLHDHSSASHPASWCWDWCIQILKFLESCPHPNTPSSSEDKDLQLLPVFATSVVLFWLINCQIQMFNLDCEVDLRLPVSWAQSAWVESSPSTAGKMKCLVGSQGTGPSGRHHVKNMISKQEPGSASSCLIPTLPLDPHLSCWNEFCCSGHS